MIRTCACILTGAAMLALAPGCSERDDMYQGARLKPFEAPVDGPSLTTRRPPQGTIPREPGPFDRVARPAWTIEVLEHGRERFDIFCAPCHARDGYGDGIVARHGFPMPPSLHSAESHALADDDLLRVIADGRGKMPPYRELIPPADQWAIVGYVRALQLSQKPLDTTEGQVPR